MSLNNSKRSLKAECVRERCRCSPSYGWGRQVCGLGGWCAVGRGGAGGRHICFIFTRGENESFRARKVLLWWGALGMMKRLNLLFPCNQFVNAQLSIISFKTDLLEHLCLVLQGTAPRALSIGDSGGRRQEQHGETVRCVASRTASLRSPVRRAFQAHSFLFFSRSSHYVPSRSRPTSTAALSSKVSGFCLQP